MGHHGVGHQLHDGSQLPRHVGHSPGWLLRLLRQRSAPCGSLVWWLVGGALVPGQGLLRLRLRGGLRWVGCLWLLGGPLLLPLLGPRHHGHLVHLQHVGEGSTSECVRSKVNQAGCRGLTGPHCGCMPTLLHAAA